MEFSKEDDRIIVFYEEDGSRWIFKGFTEKDNLRYMILEPHEETLRKEPNLDPKYEVLFSEEDFEDTQRVISELLNS